MLFSVVSHAFCWSFILLILNQTWNICVRDYWEALKTLWIQLAFNTLVAAYFLGCFLTPLLPQLVTAPHSFHYTEVTQKQQPTTQEPSVQATRCEVPEPWLTQQWLVGPLSHLSANSGCHTDDVVTPWICEGKEIPDKEGVWSEHMSVWLHKDFIMAPVVCVVAANGQL